MTYTAWIVITAALVGLSCGLMGVFLILRKQAMMADAIREDKNATRVIK